MAGNACSRALSFKSEKPMSNQKITTMTVGELYSGVTDGNIISDIALQREIVYGADKQALVIDSILTGIPLPAFYFWRNSDGILEVLDGKQRIEAVRRFRQNDLEYDGKIWKEIGPDIQRTFNGTELSVIICEGDELLKREIFRRINTLGVSLNQYEVLNGLFHGEYLEGLTEYANLPSVISVLGNNVRGKNQIHLLRWLMALDGRRQTADVITDYVREHKDMPFQNDSNRLRPYVKFVKDIFIDYSLADVYFGLALKYVRDISVWRQHRDGINKAVKAFRKSDDYRITVDKAGEIEDRVLAVVRNISVDPKRFFTPDDKLELLARQTPVDGRYECQGCHQHFSADELTVDHVTPWSLGGRTVLSNARLLCVACNSSKGNRR